MMRKMLSRVWAWRVPIAPIAGSLAVSLFMYSLLVEAQSTSLTTRQLNSLQTDGTTAASTTYYQAIMGYDGTNLQALSTDANGQLVLDGGIGALPDAVALADAKANPTTALIGSMVQVFNGTTWDRLDGVDTGALVTEICDSGSGNTLCADVETAGADNVANTENQLVTASFLYGFDNTTWDRLQVLAPADDTGTGLNSLTVSAFLSAFDGTTYDRLRIGTVAGSLLIDAPLVDNAAFTDGTTRVMPVAGIFDNVAGTALTENDVAAVRINALRAVVGTLEDGDTQALYADVETAGADNVANTENGLWSYSALMAFDGTAWDRLSSAAFSGAPGATDIALNTRAQLVIGATPLQAIGQAGNADDLGVPTTNTMLVTGAWLMAFDGTAQDRVRIGLTAGSLLVSPNLVDNAAFTDGTTTIMATGYIFDDVAGTALTENDVAAARVNGVRALVGVLEDGDTRAVYADVETAGADDLANTENGLLAYVNLQAFDGTTWDRIRSFAYNADNVTRPTVGTLGVSAFLYADDTGGGNVDRVTVGQITGSGVPGTVTTLGVDGTSSCATAVAVSYVRIQLIAGSQSRAHCCRSGTTCTASATADSPYVDGVYYQEQITDAAANDVICCIAPAAGTDVATLFVTQLTY